MTAAVMLCAGGSTRFAGGQHKLLAPFRGRPLVTWALENVANANLDEVIVVVGSLDLSPVLDIQIVVMNPEWISGQASSLQAGIAAAKQRGHDMVVVGLGDQPLIPASAWLSTAAADSPIAVATFGGHRSPPVRLVRDVWPLLPTTGDIGARELMRTRPDLVREVACEGCPIDIDTQQDLALWN